MKGWETIMGWDNPNQMTNFHTPTGNSNTRHAIKLVPAWLQTSSLSIELKCQERMMLHSPGPSNVCLRQNLIKWEFDLLYLIKFNI